MAVTTLRQNTEIDDLFYTKILFKKYVIYSDIYRNDLHWMNSFNVYGYRLKSTDMVAIKEITNFKDIRHLTGLSNVSIFVRFFPWCNEYCHLASRWHSSHVSKQLAEDEFVEKKVKRWYKQNLKIQSFRGISVSYFLWSIEMFWLKFSLANIFYGNLVQFIFKFKISTAFTLYKL
jgi:hypothetical protein